MGKYKSSECAYLKLITKNNMSSPLATSYVSRWQRCFTSMQLYISYSSCFTFISNNTHPTCLLRPLRKREKKIVKIN